ncbi:MAG: hypothetical protein JNL22_03780 [Bacteroidales bacterium]|jgi:hypothetical protein|nr:hypothetical protein [Bacteroidales bacterium]
MQKITRNRSRFNRVMKQMKAFRFIAFIGALGFILTGCPYESRVPVDDVSNGKVDMALLGKYTEKSSEEYIFDITSEGNQYRITKKKLNSEDEPTIYIGYTSKVGANQYLNIREEGSSAYTKYYIYKLEVISEGRIRLKGVSDNITEEFVTSAEFRAFIAKYENLSFFFDKDEEKTLYKEN